MTADRDRLQRELDEIGRRKLLLQQENQRLEGEQEQLRREVAELTGQARNLRNWQQAEFVLVNPTNFAVGVRQLADADGRFEVLAKDQGSAAQQAIALAHKAGIPRIACDKQLTRDVYHAVGPFQPISEALERRLSQYWAVHRYVPVEPDVPLEFVAFKDTQTNAYRMGLYLGHSAESLTFFALARQPEVVPRSRVQPGTAKMGHSNQILPVVGEGDFLDYCVLGIAHKLNSLAGEPDFAMLVLDVRLDALEEQLQKYFQRPVTGTDRLLDLAEQFGVKTKWSTAKDAIQDLRSWHKYLEDELYSKFLQVGIRVLEREELDAILVERQLAQVTNSEDYGELAHATHVVLAELNFPQQGGTYHLNVRLDDAMTGEVIWSAHRDRHIRQREGSDQYLLDSGELASVTVKEFKRLGYVEDRSADTVLFRELFTDRLVRFSRAEHGTIDVKPVFHIRDVPERDSVRYFAWWVAKHSAPLAGKVTQVREQQAQIRLGRRQNVNVGQKFRVLRALPDADGRADSYRTLDFELTAVDVLDSHSVVAFRNSEVEVLWSDLEQLQDGDVVIAKDAEPCIVGGTGIQWLNPEQLTYQQLKLDEPLRFQRISSEGLGYAARFGSQLQTLLSQLRVPQLRHNESILKEQGATHIVSGTIVPYVSSSTTVEPSGYQLTLSIRPVEAPHKEQTISAQLNVTLLKNLLK